MSLQSSAPSGFKADISRINKYAPAELIGREDETKLLTDAWAKVRKETKKRPQVLTFVALGGEGKTSLVAKWAVNEMPAKGWPACDAVFAWSFYSQGTRDQVAASSDLFLKEALTFFATGDEKEQELKDFAASPAGASEKGQRLARIVGQRRSLLILDGLEPLQYAPTSPTPGRLKDQGIAELLKGLAAASHGLCIVTTRYSLPDLKAFWQTTAPEVKLLHLSRDAGMHLLKTLGVRGTAKEFATLVEDVKGHALTLTLLGGLLKRAFHGDIRQRDRVKFEKADEKMDGGHAFRTMAAYEQWLLRDGGDEGRREVAVLRLMGLFDRPADAGCLAAMRRETIPGLTEPLAGLADDDWEFCLSGLETAKLLTVNRDTAGALVSLDAHPHLREYFARQLRTQQPDARRAAHRRLYEHLCKSKSDKKPNPTIGDLQPLYQAVAHGCQAGLQQDAWDKVFLSRILRGHKFYSTDALGLVGSDLGALACFFEVSWSLISPNLNERSQCWLLNETAFNLHALGRLEEAPMVMQKAMEKSVHVKDWFLASRVADNFAQLLLTDGKIDSALEIALKSVTYGDRGAALRGRQRLSRPDKMALPARQVKKWGIIPRARYADALNHAGRGPESEKYFREAESRQMRRNRARPLLDSMRGFPFCELLLSEAERAAWQRFVGVAIQSPAPSHLDSCRAVFQRAKKTLPWDSGEQWLLGIALAHLTLGRAALYEAILIHSDFRHLTSDFSHLDKAVGGLRDAGAQDHLPRAFLTRAWCSFAQAMEHRLHGQQKEASEFERRAQSDLDEAREIAERGPMKLHLADIHLHRARLFGNPRSEVRGQKYPWESPAADLAAAEKLINACGYHRRDKELADAKRAVLAK